MSTSNLTTLHEICVKMAKKQPGMADALTEDAPILKVCRWKASSHGLYNVAEKLTDAVGPAFVEPDAPLPQIQASSDLVHTDLHVMGGFMEVPTQRALKFGGPQKYFSERQDVILRKAGMDTEIQFYEKIWLKGAREVRNVKNAGGTNNAWTMLAVRFDEINNCGLYDPDQFEQQRLFKLTFPYGGNEHILSGNKQIYGYSVIYRANFGWQLLDAKRCVAAIVNIDETHAPTPAMIDDMLADVRAQPGSTYIFCGPKARNYGINPHKHSHVQYSPMDKNSGKMLEYWGDIPIIVSYNFAKKAPNIAVPAE